MEKLLEEARQLERRLEYYLTMTDITGSGSVIEKRALVQKINNLRIEIYPNEHPPPHFHIRSAEINATFDLVNCRLLNGNVGPKDLRRIKEFHTRSAQKLIDVWNYLRPSDCKVGLINV